MYSLQFTGCGDVKSRSIKQVVTKSKQITEISNLQCGDAKFINGHIVTNQNGSLAIMDIDGENKRIYENIVTNWIGVLDNSNTLVYGNFNKQIGIVKFDDDFNILENNIIMSTENLQIDPTIIEYEDTYYLTTTEIVGNVNNADKSKDNGEYILHLYSSTDLNDWCLVSNITDQYHNIEDTDFIVNNGKMIVVYEKEEVDKGNSGVYLRESLDNGVSWSDEYELLSMTADHEPAVFAQNGKGYILYYSCDIHKPGESYMGASAYYATFDNNYDCLEVDKKIETSNSKGILLYDVQMIGKQNYLLYSKDYLTDDELIVEKQIN